MNNAWADQQSAYTEKQEDRVKAHVAEMTGPQAKPNRAARRGEARRQKQARQYLIKIAGEVTARRNAKIAARASEET